MALVQWSGVFWTMKQEKILQICKQKRLQNSAIRVISLCRKENVITKNLVFWRPWSNFHHFRWYILESVLKKKTIHALVGSLALGYRLGWLGISLQKNPYKYEIFRILCSFTFVLIIFPKELAEECYSTFKSH